MPEGVGVRREADFRELEGGDGLRQQIEALQAKACEDRKADDVSKICPRSIRREIAELKSALEQEICERSALFSRVLAESATCLERHTKMSAAVSALEAGILQGALGRTQRNHMLGLEDGSNFTVETSIHERVYALEMDFTNLEGKLKESVHALERKLEEHISLVETTCFKSVHVSASKLEERISSVEANFASRLDEERGNACETPCLSPQALSHKSCILPNRSQAFLPQGSFRVAERQPPNSKLASHMPQSHLTRFASSGRLPFASPIRSHAECFPSRVAVASACAPNRGPSGGLSGMTMIPPVGQTPSRGVT